MSARVDVSTFTTVVWCKACPSYSELANSAANGHDLAVAHEETVHPMSRAAEINRFKFKQKIKVAA